MSVRPEDDHVHASRAASNAWSSDFTWRKGVSTVAQDRDLADNAHIPCFRVVMTLKPTAVPDGLRQDRRFELRMKRLQSSIEILAENVAGLKCLENARRRCGLARGPAAIYATGGGAKPSRPACDLR